MSDAETIIKLKQALKVAGDALAIASDWNFDTVQVYPPKEWRLPGGGERPSEGWCSTSALSDKLLKLSK